MNLKKTKECPRRTFLADVPGNVKKQSQLQSIVTQILTDIDFKATTNEIKKIVKDDMHEKVSTMLPFEIEKEAERMTWLIDRYLTWEKTWPSTLIAKNERVDIYFAGKPHSVFINRLVLRSGRVEAIRYRYKKPESSYGSRHKTAVYTNPDLLLLQLAGEELLNKINNPKYLNIPVSGSCYYMKNSGDKATSFAAGFENNPCCNINSWNFSEAEKKNMEKEYATVVPSSTVCASGSTCNSCFYNDLCNTEFNKRKLMQLPPNDNVPINKFTLTHAQYALVDFDDGICRVNAVAGSGKTTVITLRTLRLLEDGCAPDKILMLTFTDKARNEMRSRLLAYSKGDAFSNVKLNVSDVNIETFNSWGSKLLNEHYGKLGFTEEPVLIDDITKKDIILKLLDKYRMFPIDYMNPFMSMRFALGCVIQMVQVVDSLKASHVSSPDEAAEIAGCAFIPVKVDLYNFYKEYNQALVDANYIDYEDQLRLVLNLEPYGVFNKMGYEYMIVDEFQDSNPNQIELISKVYNTGKIKSLIVVGDDMQAIYGFRNATPENLVEFDKLFPEVMDINLDDNFRSQAPIINLANKILDKESEIKKAIKAHNTGGGIKPAIVKINKAEEETKLFVNQVKKLLATGEKPSSIAILCRTKGELIKAQEALSAENIPSALKVPEIIGESAYVKAIISLASFFKGGTSQVDLALYAKSLGQDPFDKTALQKSADFLLSTMAAKTNEKDKIQFFFDLCDDASEDFIADEFLKKIKALNFKTLAQLLTYCVKYKQYSTRESCSTSKEDIDAVTLITVHSAKGLEWKTVLLSIKKFRCDKEERRLFYVAVTRAKENLLISYCETKQQTLINLLK